MSLAFLYLFPITSGIGSEAPTEYLLLEDSFFLLLEDGSLTILE